MWILLLVVHIVLLILASTYFTVVTGLSDGQFKWEYFRYASQNGWGRPYEFFYSLPLVLTYLAAYGSGLAAYAFAWRRGLAMLGGAGVVLCAAGFASFALELTHWFSEHNRSWIASAPALLLMLAVAAVLQRNRRRAGALSSDGNGL